LTDQVTEELEVPETEAEKVRKEPARIMAEGGATEMEMEPEGGGGEEFFATWEPLVLQEMRPGRAHNRRRQKERRWGAQDIVESSFRRRTGEGQLDAGTEKGQEENDW